MELLIAFIAGSLIWSVVAEFFIFFTETLLKIEHPKKRIHNILYRSIFFSLGELNLAIYIAIFRWYG